MPPQGGIFLGDERALKRKVAHGISAILHLEPLHVFAVLPGATTGERRDEWDICPRFSCANASNA